MAVKYGWIDSNISLTLAFFVNASILILASAVFHYGPNADTTVADITTAHKLLAPALGDHVAPKLFAIALLSSGQQSTITGVKRRLDLVWAGSQLLAPAFFPARW